jgi:hypothetical protein
LISLVESESRAVCLVLLSSKLVKMNPQNQMQVSPAPFGNGRGKKPRRRGPPSPKIDPLFQVLYENAMSLFICSPPNLPLPPPPARFGQQPTRTSKSSPDSREDLADPIDTGTTSRNNPVRHPALAAPPPVRIPGRIHPEVSVVVVIVASAGRDLVPAGPADSERRGVADLGVVGWEAWVWRA